MTTQPKRRYLIGLFILLMFSSIVILDLSLLQEYSEARMEQQVFSPVSPLPGEAGVFARAGFASNYENMPLDPKGQRGLDTYYSTRAFTGAPPVIPHAVLSESGIGGKNCLQCHQNGGFVQQFNAYAPVTPHPELMNCKQCHVPVKSNTLFRPSAFEPSLEPARGIRAMEGSPPVIPHAIQMRENCLACHAGPAAPKEIRVSHPLRINCRQCHALKQEVSIEWVRDTITVK